MLKLLAVLQQWMRPPLRMQSRHEYASEPSAIAQVMSRRAHNVHVRDEARMVKCGRVGCERVGWVGVWQGGHRGRGGVAFFEKSII